MGLQDKYMHRSCRPDLFFTPHFSHNVVGVKASILPHKTLVGV